ncbi:LOW QUALITY PROTEIN: hypothetical protein KIPB_000670 [Kipferlia bialata]|uniref:Uncharacterized protein n=1 Tax=Kipferlia bialata TaxID=797122 RepID=A0A9K3CPE9_9EUKA|nr:LOW QUALITY PROTEIN: hypothetical protein KIPB_000670 [Kipferlia bialata]
MWGANGHAASLINVEQSEIRVTSRRGDSVRVHCLATVQQLLAICTNNPQGHQGIDEMQLKYWLMALLLLCSAVGLSLVCLEAAGLASLKVLTGDGITLLFLVLYLVPSLLLCDYAKYVERAGLQLPASGTGPPLRVGPRPHLLSMAAVCMVVAGSTLERIAEPRGVGCLLGGVGLVLQVGSAGIVALNATYVSVQPLSVSCEVTRTSRPSVQVFMSMALQASCTAGATLCLPEHVLLSWKWLLPVHSLFFTAFVSLRCFPNPLAHISMALLSDQSTWNRVRSETCPSFTRPQTLEVQYLRWIVGVSSGTVDIPAHKLMNLLYSESPHCRSNDVPHLTGSRKVGMVEREKPPAITPLAFLLYQLFPQVPHCLQPCVAHFVLPPPILTELRKWIIGQPPLVAPITEHISKPPSSIHLHSGIGVYKTSDTLRDLLEDLAQAVPEAYGPSRLCQFHTVAGSVLSHVPRVFPGTADIEAGHTLIPVPMSTRTVPVDLVPQPVPPPPPYTNRLMWPPVAVPPMSALARCFETPYTNLPQPVVLYVTDAWFRLFCLRRRPLSAWKDHLDTMLSDTRSHTLVTLENLPQKDHPDFQYAVGRMRFTRFNGTQGSSHSDERIGQRNKD